MQQRATGGIEPVVAAVRTQPLYMGRLLYHLSHRTPTIVVYFNAKEPLFLESMHKLKPHVGSF